MTRARWEIVAVLAGLLVHPAWAVEPEGAGRRNPDVLTPVEARTAVVRDRVKTYILNKDFTRLVILKGAPEGAKAPPGTEFEARFVRVQDLNELKNARPAQQPRPIRMALIAASFPLEQQAREFQKKLRLKSWEDVLQETVADGQVKQPAFRFLGVNVQRRQLGPDGKPRTEYRPLDVGASYRPWLALTGLSFEPDGDRLARVVLPGLVMPRLRLFRSSPDQDGYPPVEAGLKTLQKAIDALGDKPAPAGLPSHCLLRGIDVTIQPNEIYQYRLQVRMANPNFGRKDVAAPEMAAPREILSPWYELPAKVVPSPELVYYAVDQKEMDGKAYRGPNANVPFDRGRQVVLQAHRWIDATTVGREEMLIGDWVIAERVIVSRGEHVGQPVSVDVPIWKYTQDAFVIPADRHNRKRTGAEVNFGHERPDDHLETVLVDFSGGNGVHESPEGGRVEDTCAVEVLLLTPEGKLQTRNSAADTASAERRQRLKRWRERIEAVKAAAGEKSRPRED